MKFDENQAAGEYCSGKGAMDMKTMMIVVTLLICSVAFANAEEVKKNDFAGSSFLYVDSIHAKGQDTTQYWSKTTAKYRGLACVGLEVGYGPTGDYTLIRPFAGPVFGPLSLIGGYSTDSNRRDYAFGGIKYGDKFFGNIDVFIDSRNYSSLSKNARPFWDTLYEATYRAGKVRLGANVIYDKYWDADQQNYVLAGPIVYVDINKNIQVFARGAGDWLMTSKGTQAGTRIRAGLMFLF